MTGQVEYSLRPRSSPFPTEWGHAPGDPYSDARLSWIRSKVRADTALRAHAELADRDARLLAYLRQAELVGKREGPA